MALPYVYAAAFAAVLALPAFCRAQGGDDDATMLTEARRAARKSAPEYAATVDRRVAEKRAAAEDRYASLAGYEGEDYRSNGAARPVAQVAAAEKPAGKLLPPKPTADGETPAPSAATKSAARYPSIPTLIGGTCAVLSVFFALAWVVKRAAPRSLRGLPRDAVELLGRAPLARGQQMHLVRCGSRVLLLAVSANSTQTLAEISDPQEVDNLLLACGAHSTPHAPREVRHHAERDGYSGDRVSELLASVTGAAPGDEPTRGGRAARTPGRGTMAALVGGRNA